TTRRGVQYSELDTLISRSEVEGIIGQVADEVVRSTPCDATSVTFVLVMNGALFFGADLARFVERTLPTRIESIRARSYDGMTPGQVELSQLPEPSALEGRHVWIVDDIYDTGKTLERVHRTLEQFRPASLKSAVLLSKRGCKKPDVAIEPTVIGRAIDDLFVVGYGLDFNGMYRGLRQISVFRPGQEPTGDSAPAQP
ncbi:MAG: phosphoribosyltransferase family protein, partial [Planctomycetota bacterium]